jgi:type IV pilus assembly protein PilB
VEKLGGDIETYYRGLGCGKCRNTGYAGRIAIHELFVPTEDTKEMIGQRSSLKQLRDEALRTGMLPLVFDGIEKVKAGIVSIEEILRTAYAGGSS